MPRTKAMSTRAKELAKDLSSDQARQLAELLLLEAQKPRIDRKEYVRLQREVRTGHSRLKTAEEALTSLLTAAGKSNDEINDEIGVLRSAADRDRTANPDKPKRRGRPPKVAV